MDDAMQSMTDEKRAQLDKYALNAVRGSIIEQASARFVSQVVAEIHDHYQQEMENLENKNAKLQAQIDTVGALVVSARHGQKRGYLMVSDMWKLEVWFDEDGKFIEASDE